VVALRRLERLRVLKKKKGRRPRKPQLGAPSSSNALVTLLKSPPKSVRISRKVAVEFISPGGDLSEEGLNAK